MRNKTNGLPAVLLVDLPGVNGGRCNDRAAIRSAEGPKMQIIDIAGSENESKFREPIEDGLGCKGSLAGLIKDKYSGANIDISLINNNSISGEVVFISEKLLAVKNKSSIYFINPDSAVSFL